MNEPNNDSTSPIRMNRREMITRTGLAALGLGLTSLTFAGCTAMTSSHKKARKVLFFSKSSGYVHATIHRENGKLSFAENLLLEMGPKHGIEFTCSKDGSLFSPDYLAQFDAFMFYTTGDLTEAGTDKNPPMTPAGKQALLDAIKNGKGFVGTHTATDTFHTPEKGPQDSYHNDGDRTDPYIKMLGGEFIMHSAQQKATMHVVDPKFPGMPPNDYQMFEEWYSLKNLADDLHVLLVQETKGMDGKPYERPPYPATWGRKHGKGRVFYTSMGHREDVWTNPIFEQILFGGIAWAVGNVKARVRPNISEATPGYKQLPPR